MMLYFGQSPRAEFYRHSVLRFVYAVALRLYGGPQVSPRSKPDRIHGCVKRERGTVERFDYYTQVPTFARRHWRNFTFKSGGDQWRRQDLVLGGHDDRGAEGATVEAPKAPSGVGYVAGCPLPSRPVYKIRSL